MMRSFIQSLVLLVLVCGSNLQAFYVESEEVKTNEDIYLTNLDIELTKITTMEFELPQDNDGGNPIRLYFSEGSIVYFNQRKRSYCTIDFKNTIKDNEIYTIKSRDDLHIKSISKPDRNFITRYSERYLEFSLVLKVDDPFFSQLKCFTENHVATLADFKQHFGEYIRITPEFKRAEK